MIFINPYRFKSISGDKLLDVYSGDAIAYSFTELSTSHSSALYNESAGLISTFIDQYQSSDLENAEVDKRPSLTASPSASFDGVNDYLYGSTTISHTSGSVFLIFSPNDVHRPHNTRQVILSLSNTSSTNNYIEFGIDNEGRFYTQFNNAGVISNIQSTSTISNGSYHSIILTYNNDEYQIVIDGIQELAIQLDGVSLSWINDIIGINQVTMGALVTSDGPSKYFDGKIQSAVISSNQLI